MATIPDKYLDLLQQKKAFANLATLMRDGSPPPEWAEPYNQPCISSGTSASGSDSIG